MERIVTGQAAARVVSMPATPGAGSSPAVGTGPAPGAPQPDDIASGLVLADDLPDGLVVADRAGKIVVFNRAAARLTAISAALAVGRDVRQVLPLRDSEDRCWWTLTQPYDGLSTRSRHPERPLYLPDGTELLVSVGYVRAPRGRGPREGWSREPGTVQRIAITLRSAQQRNRLERSRADLVSTVAHELRTPLATMRMLVDTLREGRYRN